MDSSEAEEEGYSPNRGSSQHSHSNITFQQQSQPQNQHFQPHQQSQCFSDDEHSTHQEAHHREDVASIAPSEALLSSAASSSNPDTTTPPASSYEEREKDKPGGARGKKNELTPTPDSTTISTVGTSPLTSSTGDNVSPPPVTACGMAPAGALEVHDHQDHQSTDLTHQMIIASTTAPPLPDRPAESQHIQRTQQTTTSKGASSTELKTGAAGHHFPLPSLAASAPTQLSSTASGPSPAAPSSGSSTTPTSGTPAIAIKVLVSNNASGSIIGRSGQTISDLQNQSSSRIKLSQSGDCFPGTTDRVCLIQGGLDNVKVAVSLIFKKLYHLQAAHHQQQVQYQQVYGEASSSHQDQGEEVLSQAVASAAARNKMEISATTTASEVQAVGLEPGASSMGVTTTLDQMEASASCSSKGTGPSASPLPFSVRILVPTPCCGMLIGRGGSNIKSMAEASGVSSIRLSPKETTEVGVVAGGGTSSMTSSGPSSAAAAAISATSERIVTVSGPDLNRCITCIQLILDGMAAHPEMCRYVNMTTSYTRAVSAAHAAVAAAAAAHSGTSLVSPAAVSIPSQPSVSAAVPTSTSYHQQQTLLSSSQSQQQQLHGRILSQAPHLSLVLPSPVQPSSSASPMSQGSAQTPTPPSHHIPITQQQQETQKMVIGRQKGATSGTPTSPVVGPLCSPFAHRHASPSQQSLPPPQQSMYVLAQPSASRPPNIPPAAYTQQQATTAKSSWHGSSTTCQRASDSPLAGETSATAKIPSSMEQLSSQFQGASPFGETNRQSKTSSATEQTQKSSQTPPPQGQQQTNVQIGVPDNLIGAILGRGGQTLTELQLSSRTRIQISQRGVFVPGTNHRIVTITGPSVENVATAQFLINQRIARNVNRPMGTSVPGSISHKRVGATVSRDSSDRGGRGQKQQQQQQPQTQPLSSRTQQSYFLQQSSATHHQTPSVPSQRISSSPDTQKQPHRSHSASSSRLQRRHQSHHHHQRGRSDDDCGSPSTGESGGASDALDRGRRGNRHDASQQK